ncbi:MAG: CoA transferase [bacterium]|nr:CoA transferase [bacterium]
MVNEKMKANVDQPLSGISVLEFGPGFSGAYCAKLLADFGAEVIKVESPEGDPARGRGPFAGNKPHPEKSGLFCLLNLNKYGVTLDCGKEGDRKIFRALAKKTDILVQTFQPGELSELGLTYEVLEKENPRLIMVSITPYGQTGPYRDYRARTLNACQSSGQSSLMPTGELDREPLKGARYSDDFDSGQTAALATLGAFLTREKTGRGVHLDISMQEVLMSLGRVDLLRFPNEQGVMRRNLRGVVVGGPMETADGFINLVAIQENQWQGLMKLMDNPEWGREEICREEMSRAWNADEINEKIQVWMKKHKREEIYHRGQALGVPLAPMYDAEGVVNSKQTAAREFMVEVEQPGIGKLRVPQPSYRFPENPWRLRRPAPRLGEHNRLLSEKKPGFQPEDSRAKGAVSSPGLTNNRFFDLSGIRVIDFSWAWAGPYGTMLLAFMGAEVIKVESMSRLDHSRVRSLIAGPSYGGVNQPGPFNELNMSKKSLTVKLSEPRGLEIIRSLTKISDLVTCNFRPGVMEKLGIGYEDLKKIKPDIILVSSSTCGCTGPEKDYSGYAPSFSSLSGIAHLTGFADGPPIQVGGRADTSVGTTMALASLAALIYRNRTGKGQFVDISSREAISCLIGDALVAYALNREIYLRDGNRDEVFVPHNAYHCREYDQWVSIAVGTEAEWQALCRAAGHPEWAGDDRFRTRELRKKHEAELDRLITGWTSGQTDYQVTEILQKAGVPAVPMLDNEHIPDDPQVRAREMLLRISHPELKERFALAPPWKTGFPGDAQIQRHAPMLGEHNEYVLGQLLGISREEIEKLTREQVVY